MTRLTTERVALFTLIGMACLFAVVLARVAQLQRAPSPELKVFLTDRARQVEVDAARGSILDRRGRLLVSSRTGRRLFLDPLRFPADAEPAIQAVARASGYDAELVRARILPRLTENEARRSDGRPFLRYVPVGGILPQARAEAVEALKLPGVHLERRPVREGLAAGTLSAVLGKVGFEHHGLLGVEHTLDAELTPTPGAARIVRDADGDPLWIEGDALSASRRGVDTRLSLDSEIQRFAEEELRLGLDIADAAGGRLVAIDPRTGEILALLDLEREVRAVAFDAATLPADESAWPRFRVFPHDAGREIDPAMARIRCVEDAYEPGSTFKPFIWAAVLERGKAAPAETLNTHKGRWRTSYGRPIEDVVARDEQSVFEVLVNSSNIGMVQLAERLTEAQLQDAIRKFGFGAPTGLPLPGEADGIVTTPRNWSRYTTTSVAFGYEIAVTPVQMVRAFSVFARQEDLAGTMPRLSLLHRGHTDARLLHRVLPAEVALAARDAMRRVGRLMTDRARAAGRFDDLSPAYDLFGKSGTARVPRPDGRGYIQKQYMSSFVAAAPADAPRIALIVVIDDPGPERIRNRSHFGSAVAGPVAARFLHRSLEYLGVAHDAPPAVAARP